MAVAGLSYFFAAPIFSFWIEYALDLVLVIALVLASLIVTRLVGSARKQTEAPLQAEARARASGKGFGSTRFRIWSEALRRDRAIDRATDPRVNRHAMKTKTLSLLCFLRAAVSPPPTPSSHFRRRILCELATQGL